MGDEKTRPDALDLDLEGAGVFLDGALAASGIGAEILGGPLSSLHWLADHLVRRGEFLRAGDWVIAGSPVRLVSVDAPSTVMRAVMMTGPMEDGVRSIDGPSIGSPPKLSVQVMVAVASDGTTA